MGEVALKEGTRVVVICEDAEAQMAEFSKEERKEFFEEPGLEGSGLQKLIHEGYDILGLITF